MNFNQTLGACTLLGIAVMAGCGGDAVDGPPSIRYGDSICDECGMIVSDQRFATATIVVGDRGNESKIFDDFNCQMIFEFKHPDYTIVDRWCHDHESLEWMHMEDAWYVKSDKLRTPMASKIASFATHEAAQSFGEPLNGSIIDFKTLWVHE